MDYSDVDDIIGNIIGVEAVNRGSWIVIRNLLLTGFFTSPSNHPLFYHRLQNQPPDNPKNLFGHYTISLHNKVYTISCPKVLHGKSFKRYIIKYSHYE